MKPKLKIIIVTFVATTAFWCLVIIGFIWLMTPPSGGTDLPSWLRKYGYHYLYIEPDRPGSGILVVDAIQTNSTSAEITRSELLRTNLAPSQTMLLGLRRDKAHK